MKERGDMKDKVLRILPGLVFLAVFNVMFFVVTGPERSAALWTSYGFVHLSFILMLLCPLAAGRGKNAYLHTGTTTVIAAVYFLLALGVGILYCFIPVGFKAVLLVHLLLLAAFLIAELILIRFNLKTDAQEEKRNGKIAYMNGIRTKIQLASARIPYPDVKKAAEKTLASLGSSPLDPSGHARASEEKIAVLAENLYEKAGSAEAQELTRTIREIGRLIEERNTIVKNSL